MANQEVDSTTGQASSAAEGTYLYSRLKNPLDEFNVIPLPEPGAVDTAAIDLHVGSIFLIARRTTRGMLDVKDLKSGTRAFDEVRVFDSQHEAVVMQPHQFLLASTFEYLTMPSDAGGNIQSRSTYGRMGIIAATAAYVGPGYKGSPTLELVNTGEVPIRIQPYTPICQLVLMPILQPPVSEEDEPGPHFQGTAPSRYHLATRPYAFQPTLEQRISRRKADQP